MTSFETVFSYNDGHSYKIRSLDDLQSYNPILSNDCNSVLMNWIYLVEFSGRTQERQEITIFMKVGSTIPDIQQKAGFWDSGPEFVTDYEPSGITTSIEHTEISFGYDIDNLINNAISKYLVVEKNTFLNFLRKYSVAICFLLAMIDSVLIFRAVNSLYLDYISNLLPKVGTNTIMDISQKIDFIINGSAGPALLYIAGFFVSAGVTSFLSIFAYSKIIENGARSWIIINEEKENASLDYDRMVKYERGKSLMLLASTLVFTFFSQSIYDVGKSILFHWLGVSS